MSSGMSSGMSSSSDNKSNGSRGIYGARLNGFIQRGKNYSNASRNRGRSHSSSKSAKRSPENVWDSVSLPSNSVKFMGNSAMEWTFFAPKLKKKFLISKCWSLVEPPPGCLQAASDAVAGIGGRVGPALTS